MGVLSQDPAIPLLGIHPKEMKSLSQREICTPIFMTALFTIVKIWKQLKGPITDEGIKKMWFIVERNWALKKKEILPSATAGMHWEDMKLSEIGQSQKEKHQHEQKASSKLL